MTRPTWEDSWMTVAATAAARSLCSRAQVGAVIVTRDNRINSVSYNGPPPGFRHRQRPCTKWCPRAQPGAETGQSYEKCDSNHAETNALIRADFKDIQGGTIYVSGSVCIQCARLVASSGLSRIVHIVTPDMAHRRPEEVEDYLRKMGLVVERWNDQ